MAAAPCRNLKEVYEQSNTPQILVDFLKELHIESVADLIGYVEKEHFEAELRELIEGKFPVRPPVEARAAVAASDGIAASPAGLADPGFDRGQQRILISRMRSTYRKACGVEKDEEDDKEARRKETFEADMEKPIDTETRTRLKTNWNDRHGWQPVPSMKPGPKFRNRVVREFAGKCMTNHMVEKAITALQAKRPVEPDRLPVGPPGAPATLVVEREKPQTRTVTTLLTYFAALRLILGTYAYCGTHLVESSEEKGENGRVFPLGSCPGVR